MTSQRCVFTALCILAFGGAWLENVSAGESLQSRVAATFAKAPTLDGKLGGEAWRAAARPTVPVQRILSLNLSRSMYIPPCYVRTDADLFLAPTWDDASDSVWHKTWVSNANKKVFRTAIHAGEMYAIAFAHAGEFNPEMFTGVEAVADLGYWKAFARNPQGSAIDKAYRCAASKPEGKSESCEANGKAVWAARPEDAGKTVEKSVAVLTERTGDRLTAVAPGTPANGAGDMWARGARRGEWWAMGLGGSRRADHPDAAAVDRATSYTFDVAVFDQTGKMDKTSGSILFGLGSSLVKDFESDTPGKTPSGFTEALTGGGGPVKWHVIEVADAPSGKQVVAQLSQDSTNTRYPLLVLDDLVAKDVDVSVRFKPISGKVDQAAGIVWRWQDKDNYLVVRANALENNVVAYKTLAGKRTNIGIKGDAKSYGVKVEVPSGKWSTLRVRMVGNTAAVYFNDKKLFEVDSDAITSAGKVGLWTKADSVIQFDDLKITSLDKP